MSKIVPNKFYNSHRLVKSEDLNHHGSLFAGRTAEWFVESGFVACAHLIEPQNLICLKIHEMIIQKVVRLGEVLCFSSKIVKVGHSSIVVYTRISKESCSEVVVEGFATFVHVNNFSNPVEHNLELEEVDEEILKKLENENKRSK